MGLLGKIQATADALRKPFIQHAKIRRASSMRCEWADVHPEWADVRPEWAGVRPERMQKAKGGIKTPAKNRTETAEHKGKKVSTCGDDQVGP